MIQNRPTLGLALSGGGARGLAHIGVLRVLEREGIPVDYLAGTSMGGIMAAGYAAGMTSFDLEREARSATEKWGMLRMADPRMAKGGLIRGQRVYAFFQHEFGEKTFAQLRLPLAVVAVDLDSHQEVVLREGSVALALRATTSLPGIFMPLELNGQRLVDGGVLNNLPVDVVSQMGAEVIIAVDIALTRSGGVGQWIGNRRWVPNGVTSMLEVVDETLYALRIAGQENKLRQFPPDVLVCPEIPENVNAVSGYARVTDLIAAGERAAELHIAEIKALLQRGRHEPRPGEPAEADQGTLHFPFPGEDAEDH